MQSDPTDCTTDYYTSNEIIESESSPVYADFVDGENGLGRGNQDVSSEKASQTVQEIKQEYSAKKRKDDILDDFFALGEPSLKKKKKKSKKSKQNRKTSTNADVKEVEVVDTPPRTKREVVDNGDFIAHDINKGNREEDVILNRMGSVTPPPAFDKEALLAERMELEKHSGGYNYGIVDDDDDDGDDLEFLNQSTYRRSNTPSTGYQFTDQNEKNRVYILQVTSKLIPEKDVSSSFRIKGTKRFAPALDSIMSHFLKIQKGAKYTVNDVALIWIDGKTEIKLFYKPSTLRVLPGVPDRNTGDTQIPPTHLNILLIPKDNLDGFSSIYPEFKTNTSSLKNIVDLADEIEKIGGQEMNDVSIVESSDNEESEATLSKPIVIDLDEEDENSYFVIGLKGKDNKRIEVQVSSTTSIRKLLLFYFKAKGISESEANMKNAKLIFDDEELDLNGVVGETELEEDFEVQVIV